jgi:hypothetical protein
MSVDANDATLPAPPWLPIVPTVVCATLAGIVLILKRRAQQPSVSRMSDQWLHAHAQDRSWYDA